MTKSKKSTQDQTIAQNRRAGYDYFIESRYEAGLMLQGWEVKSLRAGKAQLTDSYVIFKDGEAFVIGVHITPLKTVSTHFIPDATRTRKLLLHRSEIDKMSGLVDRQGYTIVALFLYWKGQHAKCQLGLARGKQQHDKRAATKDRDWQREKANLFKKSVNQ
jgi:SsrA-binding protein